jgi:hypothetical protein
VVAPVGGTNPDEEHLKLIAIFHFVVAGLEAATGLLFIIHFGMGLAMVTGHWPSPTHSSSAPMPDFMGWLFTVFGAVAILGYETLAILTLIAGLSIRKRRHHLFCLIVAGMSCLNMPIGTALGAFTFIVLLRPSVKTKFQEAADPVALE